MLTNSDITELVAFRRRLHRQPELSGEEEWTAAEIAGALDRLHPDDLMTGLGGHGVAAVFAGAEPGPTVLFRAELDALPIAETTGADWQSETEGKGHLCGHDGHMTMLLGFGRLLARRPVRRGRVVLMFQPAEEDGSGARAVVADPRYAAITPDWAFAIHNEPGLPFGRVATRPGLMNCASRGLAITLSGRTSHAAEPELAVSPVPLIGPIAEGLRSLGPDSGSGVGLDDGFRLVTITHVRAGEPTFGITPGHAEIYATLRAGEDDAIAEIDDAARELVGTLCAPHGLTATFETHDDFAASINDAEATAMALSALAALDIPHGSDGLPMRASEDFGVFGWAAKSAMLCLGPGDAHPALHQPDYDFPDDLIPVGARIFDRIARDLLD